MRRNRYIIYLILLSIALTLCGSNVLYITISNLQKITQVSTVHIFSLLGALIPNLIGMGILIAGIIIVQKTGRGPRAPRDGPPAVK